MPRLGGTAGAGCNSGEASRLSPPALSLLPCFPGRTRPPTLDVREASLLQKAKQGTSLMLHLLRFCASDADGTSSIPGWRIEVPPAVLWSKKKKKNPMNKNKINKKPQEAKQGREGSCSPTLNVSGTSPSPAQPVNAIPTHSASCVQAPSPNDSLPTPIPKGLFPPQSPVSTTPFLPGPDKSEF